MRFEGVGSTTDEYLQVWIVPGRSLTRAGGVQGYLAYKKMRLPWDHHRALDMTLLVGPTGWRLLMSEVPLS